MLTASHAVSMHLVHCKAQWVALVVWRADLKCMDQTALSVPVHRQSMKSCLEIGAYSHLADNDVRHVLNFEMLEMALLANTGAGLCTQVSLPRFSWLARKGSQIQASKLY